MILVLGSVKVHKGKLDAALALSQEHVARSRLEPGCIAHAVHRDMDDEQRLVFVEKWKDSAALRAHFEIPASRRFVEVLHTLCSEQPEMNVYAAEELSM